AVRRTASMAALSRPRAAAIDVTPVRIDLRRAGESAELRVSNKDRQPVSVEVVARKLDQDTEGRDILKDTDEILAVPPIFTIAPGGQQIVRIAFLGQPDPAKEGSYRLLVTELDPPAGNQGAAVTMRLQINMPVFVAPASQKASPDIQLVSTRMSEQGTYITLRNAGSAHVKLKSVELIGNTGVMPAEGEPVVGQARYLLPGTTLELLVPGNSGVAERVKITSDRGRGWEYAVAQPE
ncbi:MAG: fimbria/pilus periplasmic chaperone, partial [Gammaproteobacteria bacterium]|nr:fimbria/pilus periplasmic chaperone [Gammaproteobacteria bacterium]